MSRATGRTRPKKLAPRQNIQIVREDQVDSLVEFDSGRGPIETGVEKAEESVCNPLVVARFALTVDCCPRLPGYHIRHTTSLRLGIPLSPAAMQHHADCVSVRNIIFSKPSKHRNFKKKMQRSKMGTFPRHLPSLATFSMTCCIRKASNSQRPISGRRRRSRTVLAVHTAWTSKMT